jgi:hypothetical protein
MKREISSAAQDAIENFAEEAFAEELARSGRGFLVYAGESYYDSETLARVLARKWETDDDFWDSWEEGEFQLSPVVPLG